MGCSRRKTVNPLPLHAGNPTLAGLRGHFYEATRRPSGRNLLLATAVSGVYQEESGGTEVPDGMPKYRRSNPGGQPPHANSWPVSLAANRLRERSDIPEQFLAVGWVGDLLYSVIFQVREDEEGEIMHLATPWRSTKEEIRLYEENS
jgi:hypothetical protein